VSEVSGKGKTEKVSRIAREYGHIAESESHVWKKIKRYLKKETSKC
jgi:hypothetical protein